MRPWLDDLNREVLARYDTVIQGGFEEPLYRAPVDGRPAEIRFTHDFERSALHELAHWCIAGKARRLQDDYGYWYAPDGRDPAQQQLFYRVEVRPQAIEKHFCQALGLPFEVSTDNLDNPGCAGLAEFRRNVDARFADFAADGLPPRAAEIAVRLLECRLSLTNK